jgi:hypothetical protein
MKFTTTAIVALAASLSLAQISPNIGTESATSSGLNTVMRNAARTYQAYYSTTAMSGVTSPVMITGMQFRLAIGENWRPAGYVGSSWPDQQITFSDYTVQLSQASAQLRTDGEYLSGTSAFSFGQGAGLTTVRTGSLSINANSYNATGGTTGEHSWGPTINFSTPYLFNPGDDLVLTIGLNGYTQTAAQAFFASGDFANGVTDAISSTSGNNVNGSASGFSSPMFVQFTTAPVPEPASMAVLGLGALALIRRRRAKK